MRKPALWVAMVLHMFMISEGGARHDWTQQIRSFKPMVVNIETSTEIVLGTERQGTIYGTGFVIDAQLGIIATNAHVTGVSPSHARINFYDGSFTQARKLYFDPVHDFGFYKINPEDVAFPLVAAAYGSWEDLKMGDELLFIGNNEREEYSIKFGTVANLNTNKGDRYSSYIHTTFNSAGGSSGSPVWNTEGKVVAIHSRGTRTSDFELPIDYVLDALKKIQNNVPIRRGDIGVDLELITLGEAIQHFRLPGTIAAEIKPLSRGTPKVIQVESIIPRSTGEHVLKVGDIIYRLNGKIVSDNLYLFDVLLNENVNNTVRLDIYRLGQLESIDVSVEDMEKKKINRFVRFAGAVFHDIPPRLRRIYDFAGDGVNMSYAVEGSSFSHLGYRDKKERFFRLIITEIGGKSIRNLEDFIEACRSIEDGQNTYALVRDFMQFNTSLKPKSLNINLKYGPLELFAWNDQTLDWETVDLKN